ncbi:tetratricopeptide repeat protein [Sulfitobacter sp. TSTF-M16]|uniref:Tetratricopeptide repeat protein n=3 Tax=Sulfitobacter aestuariivivens TaxID=2766981 RepID=A0A927HFJ7_9RHOB|nr:tetratricopeptide repeat protein [Sulfitobacter aestuariivivens]
METAPDVRRLTAVLMADIVGYSALMGADQNATMDALRQLRGGLFNPIVDQHRGSITKSMGDGWLVEFPSISDAVACAVAIQTSLIDHETIRLRMGIHIGEVVFEAGDVFGDGVNVAARLEALAEPGQVLISDTAVNSLDQKTAALFQGGTAQKLKNIERPVGVWSWPEHQPFKATTDTKASGSAERPAIAVLAFDNLSGDREQEYFSDGITEDIITDLSKVGSLLVISRNSSFVYKGKTPDIRQVGRELGVSHVLEGSIRRAADRIRVNAQLIDTQTGAHLWAERYDRKISDIFAVQDELTRCIVDALKLKLTTAEHKRIGAVPTANPQAHDLFLRGREAVLSSANTKEMFELALRCFNRAIELDPDYAEPYAGLGHAYTREFQNKWLGIPNSLEHSQRFVDTALQKDPEMPYAHYLNGINKFWRGEQAASHAAIERALSLNPNYAMAIGMRGINAVNSGTPLDGIPDLERALQLEPRAGHLYTHFMGMAYLLAQDFDTAIARFTERIEASPGTDLSRGLMISALGHLGRVEDARKMRDELRGINPDYSFSEHVGRLPLTDASVTDMLLDGYAKAGLDD